MFLKLLKHGLVDDGKYKNGDRCKDPAIANDKRVMFFIKKILLKKFY